MVINRDFYRVLAADNAAIVRLIDDTTGLPPIEDVRVFIVDNVNFPPSLALFLNATNIHIVFSDDGARRLFLLHRDDARELLSRTVTDKPIPPAFCADAGKPGAAGELGAVLFLGEHATVTHGKLSNIRRAALKSPRALADLQARSSMAELASKHSPKLN